jgi:hypothetical protein
MASLSPAFNLGGFITGGSSIYNLRGFCLVTLKVAQELKKEKPLHQQMQQTTML